MLNIDLVVSKTITINADTSAVWKALTDPEKIKKYFFGVDVLTTWRPGDAIYFSGTFKGQTFRDKGTIIEVINDKKLKYDYWSSWAGLEDKPENYSLVTYKLEGNGDQTVVSLVQSGFADEVNHTHALASWEQVLEGLKKLVEQKSK